MLRQGILSQPKYTPRNFQPVALFHMIVLLWIGIAKRESLLGGKIAALPGSQRQQGIARVSIAHFTYSFNILKGFCIFALYSTPTRRPCQVASLPCPYSLYSGQGQERNERRKKEEEQWQPKRAGEADFTRILK